MKKILAALAFTIIANLISAGALLWTVSAQTTTLTQTAGVKQCAVTGCINAPLSDGELFSFSDTLRYFGTYPINGRLAFRGLNYYMSGHSSGYQVIDLSSSAYENNGFAVHENYDVDYFRGPMGWDDGYLQLNNEYVGSDPFLYGYNGQVNVTSGTGQVGLVTASPGDLTVTLVSGDSALIQVPASVVILHGTLDADFTITATAPTAPPSQTLSVNVTATFPDGTVAVMTVTVQPVPALTPLVE